MPRYSSPQRNNSGPQNDLIEKEAQADSLNNSMPDLLSMGNSAILDILSGGGPVEIPLWNGKQNMSLVIGSDQKNEDLHENDQSQNPEDPNISEIDTSSRKKENPDISLIDPKGDEKEIRSESEAQEVVEKAEDHAENPEEGQPGELGQADKDMKKIRELDFEPVRMKENKLNMEVGFRSTLTQLLGVTVGKILGTVFNLGLLPFTGGIIAKDFIKSWFKRGKLQKKRNHKQIPGWDGEKFEKSEPQNNDEINVDLRKVPAVWSYPIA